MDLSSCCPSSSSSSSSIPSLSPAPTKHDVFLSFRGEDTREKFTSHLHAKLTQKNIETYIDYRLPKGGEISVELIEAIQESRISIIIFSENYASSSWCLDEVLCILNCKKERGQIVVPVFYGVDPSHVRKQRGSYAAAFAEHEERLKERMDKVEAWRAALEEVPNTAGWDSQTYKGTEADFVEAIAKDILERLITMYPSSNEFKDLVGIEKRFQKMKELLCINDLKTVRFIGIWGMGGLGKTTLARVVFRRLSTNFQGHCFLANVREESEKHGLESLKKTLFSELLEENGIRNITPFHEEKLRSRMVLIVLDDVDDPVQLEVLAADHDWLGAGSRVIVTTRDASVLRDRADDHIYELEGLASDDALQLLNLNAFKRKYIPTVDDLTLVERVVQHANGSPLALKVLGSFLHSKRKEKWESELNKLKEIPNKTVHSILKISFDGLDETEKAIFLDIVCFFEIGKATCRNYIECRLGAHRSHVNIAIDTLIDRSLITSKDNNLLMHDLLREMGWEIERRECERTRLWDENHLYHIFKTNTGTSTIEGVSKIVLADDLLSEEVAFQDLKYNTGNSTAVREIPTVFKEMGRLWLLEIQTHYIFSIPQSPQCLPNSLKCLIWPQWPWRSLPSNFMPHNLVEFKMPFSGLEKLWSGVQCLGNLKYVDLSYSYGLTDISALSQAPNLVSVDLSHCGSLREVPSLKFRIHDKFTSLDQSYHKCDHTECQKPGHLKLNFCSGLEVVENISGNVKELDLSSTKIKKLPSSICSLPVLVHLNLGRCFKLKSLPSDIQKLKNLKRLDLRQCISVDKLPVLPMNLIDLNLSYTSIEKLPSSSIEHLSSLENLSLNCCTRLKRLPTGILKFKSLKRLEVNGCEQLEHLDSLILIEFQQRVLETSIKSALSCGGLKKTDNPGVAMSFPGRKVPKWFTNWSKGDSVIVKPPSDWKNNNFLGFALCAVVEEGLFEAELYCEANFETNDGKIYKFRWDFNRCHQLKVVQKNSSKMFMWYKHENYHEYLDAVKVSFHFHCTRYADTVSACGIRVL